MHSPSVLPLRLFGDRVLGVVSSQGCRVPALAVCFKGSPVLSLAVSLSFVFTHHPHPFLMITHLSEAAAVV